MNLGPSAHVDTFCRDNLPPADQWPDLLGGEPPELMVLDTVHEELRVFVTGVGGRQRGQRTSYVVRGVRVVDDGRFCGDDHSGAYLPIGRVSAHPGRFAQ